MRNFLRNLSSVFSKLFTRAVTVFRWVGGRMVATTEIVWDTSMRMGAAVADDVIAVGRAAETVLVGTLGLPMRLLQGMFPPAAPAPGQVAEQSRQAERAHQAASDDEVAGMRRLKALARVAGALSLGEVPSDADFRLLPVGMYEMLRKQDAGRLDEISRMGASELAGILRSVDSTPQTPDGSETVVAGNVRLVEPVRRAVSEMAYVGVMHRRYQSILGEALFDYLSSLNREECQTINQMSHFELMRFLKFDEPVPGIRSPGQVGVDLGSMETPKKRSIADLKEALRAGLERQVAEDDDKRPILRVVS